MVRIIVFYLSIGILFLCEEENALFGVNKKGDRFPWRLQYLEMWLYL